MNNISMTNKQKVLSFLMVENTIEVSNEKEFNCLLDNLNCLGVESAQYKEMNRFEEWLEIAKLKNPHCETLFFEAKRFENNFTYTYYIDKKASIDWYYKEPYKLNLNENIYEDIAIQLLADSCYYGEDYYLMEDWILNSLRTGVVLERPKTNSVFFYALFLEIERIFEECLHEEKGREYYFKLAMDLMEKKEILDMDQILCYIEKSINNC